MYRVDVVAYPYATVWGRINVPDDVEEIYDYVREHWDEIDFEEPDLDFCGIDYEVC